MAKGRKKVPDEVKKLRGTDQPCRKQNNVDKFDVLDNLPKVKLAGTAKKIFKIVATELMCKQLLDNVGLDLLVAYAQEMALYSDMMCALRVEGYVIKKKVKEGVFTTSINPKRKLAESALANAQKLSSEFGFTPASRNRVMGMFSEKKEKDEFADFEEL